MYICTFIDIFAHGGYTFIPSNCSKDRVPAGVWADLRVFIRPNNGTLGLIGTLIGCQITLNSQNSGMVYHRITKGKPQEMMVYNGILWDLPSGKRLHSYGKIHHFEWENLLFLCPRSIAMTGIFGGKTSTKGPFSKAM